MAVICCVILGRNDVNQQLWDLQISETRRIAFHYSKVIVADVQQEVEALGLSAEEAYLDPMHYSASMQCVAARVILRNLNCLVEQCIRPLPKKYNEEAFDPVSLVYPSEISTCKTRSFRNSIIEIDALELCDKEFAEFIVPGPVISILFISTKNSGSFFISQGDRRALVHTLHDQVRDGRISFLPLVAHCQW